MIKALAGNTATSALILAIFISPAAKAQSPASPQSPSQKQSTEQRQQTGASTPGQSTIQKVPAQDSAQPIEKQDEKKLSPAIEALAPNAVVPPAPNVMKRNPNTINIPVGAVDKSSDFEEQPVSSVSVGSRFGVRRDPFTRRSKFHSGVDIKARWGDPVGASYPGTVSFVGWYHGYGNMVIVEHGGGIATHYAHLSSFDVEVGERVERGSILGRAGSTGRATSPHLHYEVRVDGNAVNPFSTLMLDADSPYFKQAKTVVQRAAKPVDTTPTSKPSAVNVEKASTEGQNETPIKLKEQH